MNTVVTKIPDLASELPPDANAVPDWLEHALQAPREEGWVDSGGCAIHYFRWGNPENPGLLLMHGFLAHARCFAFIA
ncbi:MAG: alpha/beta hydrolase, partial [Halieaceae bacterium]|nr:alpha/beta hydrolase [Halieaceae bacterium]